MTDTELKALKDKLWNAADMLRAGAHLAANKYGQPILGLIFLRYADILYKQHREAIEAEYNQYKGTRAEKPIKDIAIKHCGFYLPPDSVYSVINDKPDGTGENKKCVLVKNAMEAIERENPGMDGVLPKEVNPPFNVDEVLYERVKDDPRFNTYGVPKNKSKSTKKSSGDKKETVPNANYLWISYFASSLNANGKAVLVMANSASDAGGSELEIRQKMISEGIISQMVTLPSNMFSSVTLPATLWFFDKKKAQSPNRDKILFIDARSIFTQVDRAHRKFSDEQIKNLAIITRLYEGDTQAFTDLIAEYKAALEAAPETPETKDQLSKSYWQAQIDWLTERFPDGKYTDVIGLCKAASISGEDGIADQDYSLNAGRYVGVVIEDDGMTETEFANKMQCLNTELSQLTAEAQKLQSEIEKNLGELFK